MATRRDKLICLDNLRRFCVREELLNYWYRATTEKAPHVELTVREDSDGVWKSEDGRLLIVAESAAGASVATHPSCF